MRLCFEPRASFLAARDGTTEDHDHILRHCADLATAYAENSSPRDVSEAALEFHLAVINASRNGLFVTIGSAIKSALRASSEMLQKQAARPSEDVVLHESVAKAIATRKPKEASAAMEKLLEAARTRLMPLTVGHTVAEAVAEAAPARASRTKKVRAAR
jgi:GntR family galactonate operon transcriptional repressor